MGCRASLTGAPRSDAPTSGCSVLSNALSRAAGSTSTRRSACSRSRASGGSASPGSKGTGRWTRFRAAVHLAFERGERRSRARLSCADDAAALSLRIAVVLHPSGVATFAMSITNDGDSDYSLDACRISLPVPAQAQELLTVGGRWTNEFGQTRTSWIANLPHRREPTRQDIARTARCRVRGHARLHRAQRRGLGLSHRVERQLRDLVRCRDGCPPFDSGRRVAGFGRDRAGAGRSVRHADGVRRLLRPWPECGVEQLSRLPPRPAGAPSHPASRVAQHLGGGVLRSRS